MDFEIIKLTYLLNAIGKVYRGCARQMHLKPRVLNHCTPPLAEITTN